MLSCKGFALVAGALAAAASAHALTLDFKYHLAPGPIIIDANFDASSGPSPLSSQSGAYTDIPVTNGTFSFGPAGGPLTSGSFSDVSFYNAAFSGPLGPGGFQSGIVGDFGQQIYSGAEASPLFTPGTYSLAFGTLTVTAVPEPLTWTLMLLGFSSLGGALRRRRMAPPNVVRRRK